jgi:hypothetical protein
MRCIICFTCKKEKKKVTKHYLHNLHQEAAASSNVVLHGAAFACWALYALIVALRFASTSLPRGLAFFLFLSGCAIVLFQPEVYRWGLMLIEEDDAEVVVVVSPFTKWILLSSLLLVVAVVVLPVVRVQLRQRKSLLWAFSAVQGVLVWLFFRLQFVSGIDENATALVSALSVVVFDVCFLAASIAGAQIVVEVGLQTNRLPFLVLMASVCVGMIGSYVVSLEAVRVYVLAWWATFEFLLSLVLAVQSGVLAVKTSSASSVTLSRLDKDEKRRSALKKQTAGDNSLPQQAGLSAEDLYHRRLIGNVAVISCLVVSLCLALWHLEMSSSMATVALAPLLLLLADDKKVFSRVSRSAPLVFVSVSAVVFGLLNGIASVSWLKNVGLVLLTVPSWFALIWRERQSNNKSVFWVLVTFPGSIPVLLLSDVPERFVLFGISSLWTLVVFVSWFYSAGSQLSHQKI